jgi:hypothetical protein
MIFHLDICADVGQEQYYKNVLVVCEVHGPEPIFNLIGLQSLKEVFKIGGFINIKIYFRNHIKRQIHWGTTVWKSSKLKPKEKKISRTRQH